MKKFATAVWKGGLKSGAGELSTESGAMNQVSYDFKKRFEGEAGTNPEELIAAAHAACFSMALSGQLEERGINPERIDTKSTVTMENLKVTTSHLETVVTAPGADAEKAAEAWSAAKAGCPISKALNVEITLDAKLA